MRENFENLWCQDGSRFPRWFCCMVNWSLHMNFTMLLHNLPRKQDNSTFRLYVNTSGCLYQHKRNFILQKNVLMKKLECAQTGAELLRRNIQTVHSYKPESQMEQTIWRISVPWVTYLISREAATDVK